MRMCAAVVMKKTRMKVTKGGKNFLAPGKNVFDGKDSRKENFERHQSV